MSSIVVTNHIHNGYAMGAADALANSCEIRSRWCNETIWIVSIESVSGSPAAASISCKFQARLTTFGGNTGNQEENVQNSQSEQWTDITNTNNPGTLPDDDWPATLADHTLASPVIFVRRILGGFHHRLAFTTSFTGGSSPKFVVSAMCHMVG